MKISKWIWIRFSSIFLVAAILYGGYRFAYKYLINRIINDFAGAPKTVILKDKSIKLANLIIPPMPGWEDLTVYNRAPVTDLTFTKRIDLDKDVEMTLSFHYEPTQVNIEDRIHIPLEIFIDHLQTQQSNAIDIIQKYFHGYSSFRRHRQFRRVFHVFCHRRQNAFFAINRTHMISQCGKRFHKPRRSRETGCAADNKCIRDANAMR